jgi:hypothetical protein
METEFKINPKYGNVSGIIKNETHLGGVTLFYFQKITNFVKKTLIVSETETVILNSTAKPCERKSSQKMSALLEKVMKTNGENGMFKGPPEPAKCPCNIVSSFDLAFRS